MPCQRGFKSLFPYYHRVAAVRVKMPKGQTNKRGNLGSNRQGVGLHLQCGY